MRYIGSKDNLLPFIHQAVSAAGVTGGVFCDLFAGTTVVGRYFKRQGFTVYANDLMRYGYVFAKAYIENNETPMFEDLLVAKGAASRSCHSEPARNLPEGVTPREPLGSPGDSSQARNDMCGTGGREAGTGYLFETEHSRLEAVLGILNALPPEHGFVWTHYSDEGSADGEHVRMFFSAENAGRIDAIRNRLDAWRNGGAITDLEFHVLLAALLEAIPGVSNTSGTYGSFLKFWEARSQKRLSLCVPPVLTCGAGHRAFQRDGNELVREIACDVLYLDPPYNARQYAPNYHILETVARWDNPAVYGKTGLRPYNEERSQYCNAGTALAALADVAKNADCRLLLLSYNSEGIMPHDDILSVLGERGPVQVSEQPYRRYKSDSDHEHRKYKPERRILERIYAVAA